MDTQHPDIVIAEFGERREAEAALRQVDHALHATGGKLEEGALVVRGANDSVEIVDLKDTAAADIVTDAANLTVYWAIGVAKIVFNSTVSGLTLLLQSTGRLAALTGSVALFPVKKARRLFASLDQVATIGDSLEVGTAALVLRVAPTHISTLKAALDSAGGHRLDAKAAEQLNTTAADLEKAVEEIALALDTADEEIHGGSEDSEDQIVGNDPQLDDARNGDGVRLTELRLDGPSMAELEDRTIGQDLTKIKGIGPSIMTVLNSADICSYVDLATTEPQRLRAILAEAGVGADPSTWPQQAQLAMRGRWSELRSLQARLGGNREG